MREGLPKRGHTKGGQKIQIDNRNHYGTKAVVQLIVKGFHNLTPPACLFIKGSENSGATTKYTNSIVALQRSEALSLSRDRRANKIPGSNSMYPNLVV